MFPDVSNAVQFRMSDTKTIGFLIFYYNGVLRTYYKGALSCLRKNHFKIEMILSN